MSDIVGGADIRDRNWFITINPNAECYSKIKDILLGLKYKHYSYIYHKADEDNVNDNHIHLCLELQYAKTYSAIQSYFIGSHIEHMKFKCQSYKYLIHLENDNKIKYEDKEVITDSREYYLQMINSNEFEKLDTETLIKDINAGYDTISAFVKKYGIYQISRFVGLLNSLIREQAYQVRIDNLLEKIIELNNRINELEAINKDLLESIEKDLPF